ncbi:hypothetical protein PYW08_014278 [Mythimna loreyi]|uniref:Uncharacterized protein n=1 Tax=Mythimna loreyi TaxID=667449 RepID=A0ACC2R7H2_9NEOP|nr:hypothetical protein PYW08_014278 [Mythimna loreyi]
MQEQIQGVKSCKAVEDLILNNSKPECNVSICQNYCLEGNCTVNAEGKPTCSCETGYTGERCEVNACVKHCLHNGACCLDERDELVCECTAGYEGERCEVAVTHAGDCAVNSTQQVLKDLRSEVKQVFKEELKRILQLLSDKLDRDEANC